MPILQIKSGLTSRTNWNPKMIPGLQIWLDSSSVSLSGSAVSSWNDLSENSRNFSQASILNQPTYSSTGINNTPALNFNGMSSVLNCTNLLGILNNVSACTFGVVLQKPVTNNTGVAFYVSNNDNANNTKASVYQGSGSQFGFFGRRLDVDTSQNNTTAGFAANTPYIQIHSLDYANGFISTRTNGTPRVTNAAFQTAGNTTPANPLAASIGKGASSSLVWFNGLISDVVVFHSNNITDIQKLEWYLANKRNMMASLPINHPYKNNTRL